MSYYFEFFVAWNYLRSKQKHKTTSLISLFSLIGISIGVMVLIVVTSVMNGFHNDLIDKVLGNRGHVSVQSYGDALEKYEDIISVIENQFSKEIKSTMPVIERHAVITGVDDNGESSNINHGVLIKSLRLNDLERALEDYIIEGKVHDGSLNNIIIGHRAASILNVGVGDELKMLSTDTIETIFGVIPVFKNFKITGIFNMGIYDYDNSVVYISLKDAQDLFNLKDKITNIDILLHNPHNSDFVMNGIRRLLHLPVTDWKRSIGHFFDAIQTEKNVMFLILTMIIFVAAFNIISSMTMLAHEKRKSIAMMKVMGASNMNILLIFFICGSFIGITGTIIGIITGLFITYNIEFLKDILVNFVSGEGGPFDDVINFLLKLPFSIEVSDIVTISLMSMILSTVATIIPAINASRSDPASIIRYEN